MYRKQACWFREFDEFQADSWLTKQSSRLEITPLLLNFLDLGEASVIQLALNQSVKTLCIDEAVGRRIARLKGWDVSVICKEI